MKNRITILCTAYLLLLTAYSFSQEYRNSGFSKPMNLPFNLAGSFGEPRPDHFHSGIDIKTNGVEGEPVLAVYEGYISKIRVSPYGYGKAIYITHPNGFTTVYGHLSRFYGEIEKYIHAQHYLQKKSEPDLTLDAKLFPLRQGDTIAFSGNTGGSSAPHLHFEVRNTKTEHALNPLDFYPRSYYADTIPPQINKVKIYQLNEKIENIFTLIKVDDYLTTEKPIEIHNNSLFRISLEGFDKQDFSENKNGIKKIDVFRKDSLIFKYDLTEIDFDKTRMCNAFVDYNEMINDSGYFYNCFRLTHNILPYYTSINNGIFEMEQKKAMDINISCYDYNENKTKIKLSFIDNGMRWVDDLNQTKTISKYIIVTKSDSIIAKNFKIIFTNNTFYENIILENNFILTKNNKSTSGVFNIFNSKSLIPLHKPAKIEFKSSIKKDRNKVVIVRQNDKGKETALKTTFDKTKFYADTKELGSFYLKYDTTKPIIILDSSSFILNTKYSVLNTIKVKITDNLSGIDTYNAYIDDQWVNFYYDAKNNILQYNFDEYCIKGEHLLKMIVTDKVGNKNTVTQKFTY